jgi:Na+-driven multidrug efflux pump
LFLFPILNTQGFIPIAGYNHGAQNYERVKESIQISIKYAALLASINFLFYTLLCNAYCIRFTTDPKVIAETPDVFALYLQLLLLHPIIELPFSGGGNAKKALLLTLSKQGFF